MKRHPAKHELMGYAENLVDNNTISANIAAHVKVCPSCKAEVEGMRNSLEFVADVPQIDVSTELTASILQAVRNEPRSFSWHSFEIPFVHAKGIVCAAAITFVVAAGFIFMNTGLTGVSSELQMAGPFVDAETTLVNNDSISKITSEIQTLTIAVATTAGSPQNIIERRRRREAQALDTDLAEAMEALKRNPRCRRASTMMYAKLERQAQNLRALYVKQSP